MSTELFERHRALLELAQGALATRTAFSAYPENPAEYSEVLGAEGSEAFANYCGSYFYLDQPGIGERIGEELSPYGTPLAIQYPKSNLNTIIPAAIRAKEAWSRVPPDVRAGACLEILRQLNIRSFEMAHACMHTTGASFEFAFRYGGPLAQERGLEAVAIAHQEMKSIPTSAVWERGTGSNRMRLEKSWRVTGLGVGIVVGCSTLPTWSAYPGLFASLVTGNAVVVKPHPLAVLPMAITVGVSRHVLKEAGFDPNLVTLVVDEAGKAMTEALATRPEVRLIDYTGNRPFSLWLAANAPQAKLRSATGAINPVVIDGTADMAGLLRNLALSVALFAGRMCTSPRVIFGSREGVRLADGRISWEEFEAMFAREIERLLSDAGRAESILGAMRRHEYDACVEGAARTGEVIVESRVVSHTRFSSATLRTPLVVRVKADQTDVYMREWFGPVVFLVECDTTAEAISRAARIVQTAGAVVAALHAFDAGVRAAAEDAFAGAGVALCINFTRNALMNDAMPFSDFHGADFNPAGNASMIDSAFVANRFRTISSRAESQRIDTEGR